MNEEEINKKLLDSSNPFSGTIIRSPWDESPDVESINGRLTNQVLDNLKEVKEQNITKMMLIQGQPGVGKTHFLSRLRRISSQNNYLFVTVKPISAVTSIFSHIYREIFTSLRKKGSEDISPMESLIGHMLSSSLVKALKERRKNYVLDKKIVDLLVKLEQKPTMIIHLIQRNPTVMELLKPLTEVAIKHVEGEYPEVEVTLLNVLFKTLNKDLYIDAMRWLQGDDLDDDMLENLGISKTIADEEMAQRVLHSIMTLSDRPLLLCFDQLEAVSDLFGDSRIIVKFFDVLVRLCNETPNALILLMAQTVIWDEQLRPHVRRSDQDRIEDIESFQSPTDDEMIELVGKRLNSIWGLYPYQPDIKTYPFTENYIKKTSEKHGRNPRYVLRELAQSFKSMQTLKDIRLLDDYELTGPTKVVIEEVNISDFLDNQLNTIVSNYKDTITDSPFITKENYLEAGFLSYFNGISDKKIVINDFSITYVRYKSQNRDIDFIVSVERSDGSKEKWGIEVCNNERGQSFYNLLQMIQRQLNENSYDRWIIIRDSNLLPLKKGWKKTNELLEDLSKSGKIYPIDVDDDARVFASKELLDSSSAGDLDLEGKTISRKDVQGFLLENVLSNIHIIYEIFGKILKKEKETPTISKRDPKKKKEEIRQDIINRLEINSILNIKGIFKDFDKRQKEYEEILKELEKENVILIVVQTGKQVVISKKGDSVF